MTFDAKLRCLCALHNWNQAELVRQLATLSVDVSAPKVNRWWQGKGQPALSEAAALGRLFSVSVDYLAYPELQAQPRAYPSRIPGPATSRRPVANSADHAKVKRRRRGG